MEENRNKTYMRKKIIAGLLISVLLILLDQFTKWMAISNLKSKKPFVIWEGVFELHYLENRGMAFGMFQGGKIYFIILTIIALFFIAYFYLKRVPEEARYRFLDVICIFFFAGAVGNFIDRVFRDFVVDFFYFKLIDFPIFNVADIYVTGAAIAMFVVGIFYYEEED